MPLKRATSPSPGRSVSSPRCWRSTSISSSSFLTGWEGWRRSCAISSKSPTSGASKPGRRACAALADRLGNHLPAAARHRHVHRLRHQRVGRPASPIHGSRAHSPAAVTHIAIEGLEPGLQRSRSRRIRQVAFQGRARRHRRLLRDAQRIFRRARCDVFRSAGAVCEDRRRHEEADDHRSLRNRDGCRRRRLLDAASLVHRI